MLVIEQEGNLKRDSINLKVLVGAISWKYTDEKTALWMKWNEEKFQEMKYYLKKIKKGYLIVEQFIVR